MTLPSPTQLLGIPGLDDWYPGQEKSFRDILGWHRGSSRFLGVAVPTGGGKSALALLVAKMTGARTVIVTATKGLQEQYIRTARTIGGVNVVGQNNFACNLVPTLRADEGPCHDGLPCPVREACRYRVQLNMATHSPIVITNYAYYLAQTNFSAGLGDIDLIVLDEAHMAFSAMENFLTIYLSRLDIEPMGILFPKGDGNAVPPWGAWRSWADASSSVAEGTVAALESDVKGYQSQGSAVPGNVSRAYRTARSVSAHLERLSSVSEEWVIQQTRHGYRFVPKWVDKYTDKLFQEVPKVMLMSAILSHKTCDYLGVPDGDDRAWLESPSYFPSENTPIWHIPTARINFRTDDYGSTLWAARVDQIIQRRLDRKGIVFTVSYERARMLLARSRFKDIMLTHSTKDVVQVVDQFKRMPAPAVLVSPTVTTGWDFPSSDGRPQYIIAGKIPYPDTRDDVTQARHKEDKDWTSYLAMGVIVQESGRCTRSMDALTEVFFIDDNAVWFLYKFRHFAPQYFRDRYKGSLTCVPDPIF